MASEIPARDYNEGFSVSSIVSPNTWCIVIGAQWIFAFREFLLLSQQMVKGQEATLTNVIPEVASRGKEKS